MPVMVNVIFSIVVLATAAAMYAFLSHLGQHITPYLAIFLGVFSVAAFWIFPEVSHKKERK